MKVAAASPKGSSIFARISRRFGSEEGSEELPFAFMLTTLMASCGISPYESFKRLRAIEILPFIQKEANEIVRQVEVLNKDPLTAMLLRADATNSPTYGDFLRGYVSTVESGGSVTSYLKSKLRSIFEVRAIAAVRSIERLETLVEAYMVMLLVLLCGYILATVMSPAATSMPMGAGFGSQIILYLILFVFMPLVSMIFMLFAQVVRKSTLMNLRGIYYKALPALAVSVVLLALITFVPEAQVILTGSRTALETTLNSVIPTEQVQRISENILPIFVTSCLIAISLFPTISYRRMIGLNMSGEDSIPSFLRDVSETRKTGMSPEKSIVHGVRRKGYGLFTRVLQQIVNQIEWGVSLRRIFEDLKERIRSWNVLTNFLILIEAIEVGGGSPEALELLASYSEKIRDVEKSKRDMLRPYVVMPFIWAVLMALTFTFTFYVVAQLPMGGSGFPRLKGELAMFSCAIVFQSWLSGFFIGKVTQGTFAAGFQYSVLLAVTSVASLMVSQSLIHLVFGALL